MSAFPETIFDLVYDDPTAEYEQPESEAVCPADEALIQCVNQYGHADPGVIASLTGKSPQVLLSHDLRGAVFQAQQLKPFEYETSRGHVRYSANN